MSSFLNELAGPVEQLRATLVEINASELTCMTNAVASASQGKSLPEVQAVMARCRQTSATAAATAVDTFRHDCSEIGAQANSLAQAAIVQLPPPASWTSGPSQRAPQLPSPLRQRPCSRPTDRQDHPGDHEYLQRPGIVDQPPLRASPQLTRPILHRR